MWDNLGGKWIWGRAGVVEVNPVSIMDLVKSEEFITQMERHLVSSEMHKPVAQKRVGLTTDAYTLQLNLMF